MTERETSTQAIREIKNRAIHRLVWLRGQPKYVREVSVECEDTLANVIEICDAALAEAPAPSGPVAFYPSGLHAQCRKCGNDHFELRWDAGGDGSARYRAICTQCADEWGTFSRGAVDGVAPLPAPNGLQRALEIAQEKVGARSDVSMHDYGGQFTPDGVHRSDCRWCALIAEARVAASVTPEHALSDESRTK